MALHIKDGCMAELVKAAVSGILIDRVQFLSVPLFFYFFFSIETTGPTGTNS